MWRRFWRKIVGVVMWRRCRTCGRVLRGLTTAPDVPVHLWTGERRCYRYGTEVAEYR